jgi:hypothetical protein
VDWECDGDHAEMTFTPTDPGWCHVGARLWFADGSHDFGWEAVDLRVLGGESSACTIESQWKVSSRL